MSAENGYAPRLRTRYRDEVVPALKDELGLANVMQVPGLEKVVINMGVGEAVKDGRLLDAALEDLAIITGQKAVVTKARKSIAGFKLREGMAIGAKVTLRGAWMWEFVDRLVAVASRIRDFRGLSPTAFDGHGNYTLGVTEQPSSRRSTTTRWSRSRGWTSRRDDRGRRRAGTRAPGCTGVPVRPGSGRGELRETMAKSVDQQTAATAKFRVRGYTRCRRCGRSRAVYRKFLLCRICFRELAHLGELPG